MNASGAQAFRACHCCGLVHDVSGFGGRVKLRCTRCGASMRSSSHPRSAQRAAALSMAALVLYPLAMLLPVIEIEQMGYMQSTTILSGVVSLLGEGQLFVGLIVLACSVVAPVLKLIAMFALSAGDILLHRKHRAATYRLVEWIGRWGMVDVLLVALLVAAVKLGDWVEVHPGPGVIAFAGVVILSLLASAVFDPHAIWEDG